MTALRWGFLGASRIGERALAPAILAADGHRFAAVGARDPARAHAFASAFGDARALSGYQAVIDDPAVDCIYIALTNEAHLPWTVRALEAGKHVLCEKPLALDAAEVATMRDAAARCGRIVMEAFAPPHHPQFAAARARIESGALGRLVAMQASFVAPMPDEDFRWHAAHGGGALFDLGCYCLVMMRLLTGREPRRVAAMQSTRGDVDATLAATLDFGDGLLAQFTVSFETGRGQHLALIGTDGALHFDWPFSTSGRATTLRFGETVERFEPMDAYRAMVEHLGRAVTEGAPMLHPLSASLAQARAMDALFKSARSGSFVEVATAP